MKENKETGRTPREWMPQSDVVREQTGNALAWTREKPSKTGWYWASDCAGDEDVVWVKESKTDGMIVWSPWSFTSRKTSDVEYDLWYGPLPVPDYDSLGAEGSEVPTPQASTDDKESKSEPPLVTTLLNKASLISALRKVAACHFNITGEEAFKRLADELEN